MRSGFIGLDGSYYASMPAGQQGISISDLDTKANNAGPSKTPSTWNLSARVTKELGNFGGLSLFVNNCLFYEPYLKGNNTSTLSQRNTNNFSYGVELYFNL